MIGNQSVKNDKPQDKAATKSQGKQVFHEDSDNPTILAESKAREELNGSKSRYEKGMELYKQGKVSITGDGLFKVSGYYEVNTGTMKCECPDYKNNRRPCKHIFACLLFVKNRGKQSIENLEGIELRQPQVSQETKLDLITANDNGATHKDVEDACGKSGLSGKRVESGFDKQFTITRLAVLNTATEIAKTWGKPVEFSVVISLAAQLEKWALGQEVSHAKPSS
jgi:hypothetical protein